MACSLILLLLQVQLSFSLSRRAILGGGLILAPFFFWPGEYVDVAHYQALFLQSFTFLLIFLFGAQATKQNTLDALIIFVFSLITFKITSWAGYFQSCMAMAGGLFICAIRDLDDRIIKKSLGIACLLSCAFIWAQYFGFSFYSEVFRAMGYMIKEANPHALSGSLGNVNHSGAFIAATMFFLPAPLWVIPAASVLVMQSAMPIASMIFGLAVYFIYKSKRLYLMSWLASFFAVLAGLAVWGAFGGIDSGRFVSWQAFLSHPNLSLLGHGFGAVPDYFANSIWWDGKRYLQMHNELLESLAMFGVFGVICFLILVYRCLKPSDHVLNAVMLTLLFNSLGNFTFHIAPLFIVFAACYALHIRRKSWLKS